MKGPVLLFGLVVSANFSLDFDFSGAVAAGEGGGRCVEDSLACSCCTCSRLGVEAVFLKSFAGRGGGASNPRSP